MQHGLQQGSLITFPKEEENLGNNRKPMHQVYLPSVPTFGLSAYYQACHPTIGPMCCMWASQRWSLETFLEQRKLIILTVPSNIMSTSAPGVCVCFIYDTPMCVVFAPSYIRSQGVLVTSYSYILSCIQTPSPRHQCGSVYGHTTTVMHDDNEYNIQKCNPPPGMNNIYQYINMYVR